jgi:hypothetical protein
MKKHRYAADSAFGTQFKPAEFAPDLSAERSRKASAAIDKQTALGKNPGYVGMLSKASMAIADAKTRLIKKNHLF